MFELSRVCCPKICRLKICRRTKLFGRCNCNGTDNFLTVKAIAKNVLQDFGLSASYKRSNEPFLHPGISADIKLNGQKIGFLGAMHPSVLQNYDIEKTLYILELDYDKIWQHKKSITFKPLSKFQAIERDLAFLVKEETPAQELIDHIQKARALS